MRWGLLACVLITIFFLNTLSVFILGNFNLYSSHIELYVWGLLFLSSLAVLFTWINSRYIHRDDQSGFLRVFGISMMIKVIAAVVGFSIAYKSFHAGKYYSAWYFSHYIILTFIVLLTVKTDSKKIK